MHTYNESGGSVPAFLAKLWRLVEDPETNNLIYWSKDGNSFVIQNQAQFARELLPLNYKHNNMASFIRQLNMYGFHKITSIDNGGLKFDRDDMEFSHVHFRRDMPFMLDQIKRKIANPKHVIEEKSPLKPETVSKVLTEVKVMRGRQDSLDSRFSAMKQENEALWREIAVLRQKHMKQQQIVNKLIQFLVTLVQPSRNMSGVKRHFQLMINDVPQPSKVRKCSETESGPIIHELGEELLDEVVDDYDPELMEPTSPNVLSPGGLSNQMGSEMGDDLASPYNSSMERPQSSASVFNQQHDSNQGDGNLPTASGNNSNENAENYVIYHINEMPDKRDINNHQYAEENVLNTPMVKKEMERSQQKTKKQTIHTVGQRQAQQQQQQSQINPQIKSNKQQVPISTGTKSKSTTTTLQNPNSEVKIEKDLDPLIFLDISQDAQPENLNTTSTSQQQNSQATDDKQMYTSKEDFISTEIPSDLFEDSPMIGDINLASGSYNPNIDFKTRLADSLSESATLQQQQQQIQQENDTAKKERSLAIAKYNNNKYLTNEDILRLSTTEDVHNHLDGVQGDLENLKELLRGDGYSLDANTLLGSSSPANRLILSPSLDGDLLAKLFSDSDILGPYGLSLPVDSMQDKTGSEVMTYQPYYSDLSDMLDINSENTDLNENNTTTPSSTLNTPHPERD